MSEMKIYDGDLVYASFTKYYAYVDISQNKLYETDCRVIYERLASNDYRITSDSQSWLEVFDSILMSRKIYQTVWARGHPAPIRQWVAW